MGESMEDKFQTRDGFSQDNRLNTKGYSAHPLCALPPEIEELMKKEREDAAKEGSTMNYADRQAAVKENILEEANRIIHGARNADYGHPLDDFSKTAKMWEAILGVEVTAEQIALCMICVKISRLRNTPNHHDSIVDIAGYAGTYEMVIEERTRREKLAQAEKSLKDYSKTVGMTGTDANGHTDDNSPVINTLDGTQIVDVPGERLVEIK